MNEQGVVGVDDQETDVWWGAYSGRALLPSLTISFLLTGLIVWIDWLLVERRHVQWTFWSLTGAVWLVQAYRWSWRVFGVNYRLTNRRLRIDVGHFWRRSVVVELTDIAGVEVRRDPLGKLLNVGRIIVRTKQGSSVALVAVAGPDEVAKQIMCGRG